jgi:hypothetical protein
MILFLFYIADEFLRAGKSFAKVKENIQESVQISIRTELFH